MTDQHYDVAILGMGPVGCTAAILLAHAGLRIAAIEQDEEVYKLPRAVNLDGEIVRAMQPAGLAEALNALLQPVRAGERAGFANSKREWLFGNVAKDFGANGWQPMNMFDQPEIEGFLRQTALAYDRVHAMIPWRANTLTQTADRVEVDIEHADNGAHQRITADYLIGCDGAASFVRKTIGSGWLNLGYDHDWLVVDVIVKPGHTLTHSTVQVCDPDRISTYVCTKDPYRRWEFKLNEGETWDEMLAEEKIHSLIDPWTPRNTYEIRRAAMYQFHAATADTWRDGRILIAGDAAHQTPPFLGQGMNTGMRDVVNLGWKLPMVVNGQCGPGLLDSYQAERDAHAHDLVDWAVSIGQLMEHLAAVEAAQRAGEEPPEIPAKLQASGYGQGREQPPLRKGVIIEAQVSQSGATGYLFSQPIVRDGDNECRLDDLLGPGFAIVVNGTTPELSADAQRVADQLAMPIVDVAGLAAVRGHFDRVFESADAVVVRPDRYVYGHTDAAYDLNALLTTLAAKLELPA